MILAASFDVNDPELWLNRGLAYGDGLFETMRFEIDSIPLISLHIQRLNQGLNQLNLNGFNPDDLVAAVTTFSNRNMPTSKNNSAVMKLVVFRASQSRMYKPLTADIDWVLSVDDLPLINNSQPLKVSVSTAKLSTQPLLAGLKHLSRLEQVMLSNELNGYAGIDDLLLINDKNNVIETTYQNLIMIKNGRLFTPKLNDSGVNGVALAWLKTHFTAEELDLNLDSLIEYDGMMVCNSIRGFRTVESIQNKANQKISFGTSHQIHDKINALWQTMLTS